MKTQSEKGYKFLNNESDILDFITKLDSLVAIHETLEPEPDEDVEMYLFNLEKLIDCSRFLKGYLGIKNTSLETDINESDDLEF